MDDGRLIGLTNLSDVLSDLMERINAIKVMLWAGDATGARSEMEEIRNLYEIPILKALQIKSDMLSRNRARGIRAEVESQFLEKHRKGWELDYLIKAQVAKQMSARNETEAVSFAIAPIASLITKLDRRISSETDQRRIFSDVDEAAMMYLPESSERDVEPGRSIEPQTISDLDTASGFRLLVFSRSEQTWEMRGYQLDPPALDPQHLVRQLKEQSDVVWEALEEDLNDRSWPFRIQGFSTSGHLKLTVFDAGRFSLVVTLKRDEDRDRWFRAILSAIAKGQHRQ